MFGRISFHLRTNRIFKFFLIHAIFSAVAGAMIIKNYTHNQGTVFPRYFITFVEAFLGSFGGALLSIVLLIKDLFLGYSGTGVMVVFDHSIPMPIMAGGAAFGALLFYLAGMRSHGSFVTYVAFILSSGLFLVSAYIYFVEMASMTGRLIGL